MKTVIVGVSGGVAYPIEVPEGVTLEIRDYDNAIDGAVDGFDSDGNGYCLEETAGPVGPAGEPHDPWHDNQIQYPRFIDEAQCAGAFTPAVLKTMADEMDLGLPDLYEIMERAMRDWEAVKRRL